MTELLIALLFITIMIAFYATYRAGRHIGQTEERIRNLEKSADEYKPRNHTHKTIAGIEDAIAVLVDSQFTADELQARLDTARRILGAVRQGPHAYDPDREAGLRERDKTTREKE